jgi:hypothetical protein
MKKTYVIKNIITKKYVSQTGGWTKDIFCADQFDQQWVNQVEKSIREGEKEMSLCKNERFIEVKMIEA